MPHWFDVHLLHIKSTVTKLQSVQISHHAVRLFLLY